MNPVFNRLCRVFASGVALLPLMLCNSCESALSDVEISDPSVLQTFFAVKRTLLDNGTVVNALQANVYDKNMASVELKNGRIKVNGQAMSLTEILNISTYHIPSPTVDLNKVYDFDLELPNGATYSGSVTTQSKTFTSVSVPSNANVENDLPISWEDAYIHDEMTISLQLTTPTGTVDGASFSLTQAQMQEGSFIIPKSNFATPAGITSVTITIIGRKSGTIATEFRNGSQTVSTMSVQKNVMFQ